MRNQTVNLCTTFALSFRSNKSVTSTVTSESSFAQATYSYERAEHASVTRAYGEMTIGLLVTAAVAILTQATGAYIALIQSARE